MVLTQRSLFQILYSLYFLCSATMHFVRFVIKFLLENWLLITNGKGRSLQPVHRCHKPWGSSMWDYTVQIQLWFGCHLLKMPPNPNESLWLKVLLLPHALSTGDLQRRLGLLSCSFWQGIHSLFSISILSFVWPDPLLYMVQYRFWYKQCCHFVEVLDWGMCLQKGLWTQTFCAS